MPKFLLNRWHGRHTLWTFGLILLLDAALFAFAWWIGIVGLFLFGGVLFYTVMAEKAFRKDLNGYVATLSHRVKRAANEVINEMPLGILLYNEDKQIEWHNPFVSKMLDKESAIGQPLFEVFPALKDKKEVNQQLEMTMGSSIYRVLVKSEERLLYFYDISAHAQLQRLYEEQKPAIGIVMLDNLDEVSQGMDDQTRSMMLTRVTGEITDWAARHHVYLRRVTADKFIIFMDQKGLRSLEQSRFDIMDEVRDMTIEHKLPMTLSIGIGSGEEGLIALGHLAQTSLDIALGRGGDQAAVKVGQKLTFYGGKTNAVEKRTRVRARVISHALRDLLKESDNVMIMGHKNADMDAIGAAIGVLKAAQISQKEAYIVLENINPSIRRLMDEIRGHEELAQRFITPEQALQIVKPRTMTVVVDTHRASMVPEPKLLQHSHRTMVVDHHRRSEEFISDAVLVYMEPYASSTCELVTELLQYFHDRIPFEPIEATALLAGIVVDTRSFSMRTGARTFEAASFLKRNGADSMQVQHLLKEDIEQYMKKTEIMRNTEVIYEHIAIAAAESGRKYSQLLIAQVADTLLDMTEIEASFVIAERTDGQIGISARSLGQINVQVIMERLGGGGHLTNAATQLDGTTREALAKLKEVLAQIDAEEGLIG